MVSLNINKLIIAPSISFVCSVISIFVAYVRWDMLFENFSMAVELFIKWPWFSGILSITVINFLFPFFYIWFFKGHYDSFINQLIAISIFISPLGSLLIYPGTRKLEVSSDSVGLYVVAGIVISQIVTTIIVGKEVYNLSITKQYSKQESI